MEGEGHTNKLRNTFLVRINAGSAEANALVCICAQQDGHFREAALRDADLGILFDELPVDGCEPFESLICDGV
jgi:hypothetical protein